MKKLISLLMAVALILCCIPVGAFATDEQFYTVAGFDSLCGTAWNPGDANNQMTLNTETGLYEKVYKNVAAGTFEFKVTDGTWDNSWGMDGANGENAETISNRCPAVNILEDQ